MVSKIRMPRIDANVDEAAIGHWLKDVGDRLAAGEPLVEIVTDKATFQLESERTGFLRSRLVVEKSVVPVGYIIALLSDDENETLPDVASENETVMQQHREALLFGAGEPVEAAGRGSQVGKTGPGDARPRATPAARKLAERTGVPLDQVRASADGIVREDDVLDYIRRSGQHGGDDDG